MTGQQIIDYFRTLVDDQLGDDGDLDLLNRAYRKVLNDRAWSFLLKSYPATSWASGADYIALPADFVMIPIDGKKGVPIIYVGDSLAEYRVIPMTARRNYRDAKYYFYVDPLNSRLYSTEPFDITQNVEFDYIHYPADLTVSTSPIFWADLHAIIAYEMVQLFLIADQEEKGRSYYTEAAIKYAELLDQMRMRDARVKLAI